jgi:predicted enzyme related to lactoylglutathione lyase
MSRPLLPLCVVLFAAASVLPASGKTEHGQVLWLDLVTEDAAAASDFYAALFGWDIEPRRDDVLIASYQGREIAGIVQIGDALPGTSEAQWLVGIVTRDLEKSVAAARREGASVLRTITEVPDSGRYAVIRDPQGAVFIVGTPERDIGGPREPGFFVWSELWTDDVDAAASFYATVLGYERGSIDRSAGAYEVLQTGGEPRAGLVPTPNEDVDPAWAPYIGVADLRSTLGRAAELGGRVVLEPRPDFGGGRVALIEDPTGAMIFVVQLPPSEEVNR